MRKLNNKLNIMDTIPYLELVCCTIEETCYKEELDIGWTVQAQKNSNETSSEATVYKVWCNAQNSCTFCTLLTQILGMQKHQSRFVPYSAASTNRKMFISQLLEHNHWLANLRVITIYNNFDLDNNRHGNLKPCEMSQFKKYDNLWYTL